MLLEKLITDLHAAMKTKDAVRVQTLRFLIAAIKKFEIDTYPPAKSGKMTEQEIEKIIRQQIKNHKESIVAFEHAGRQDLLAKEKAELDILLSYLPPELTDEEIRTIVVKLKASGVADFGRLMGLVMKEVAGRAGGERVARIVKQVS